MAKPDPILVKALESALAALEKARRAAKASADYGFDLPVKKHARVLKRLIEAARKGDRKKLKGKQVSKARSLIYSRNGRLGGAGKHKDPGGVSAENGAKSNGRPPKPVELGPEAKAAIARWEARQKQANDGSRKSP